MSENNTTSFETVFYPFLERVLNDPSILDTNPYELKAILNYIRLLNKPGELEAILPKLWNLKLVMPKIHNTTSGVIAEIERNLKNMLRKPKTKNTEKRNIIEEMKSNINKPRKSTSDEKSKTVLNFIKG